MSDPKFVKVKEMFHGVLKEGKADGKGDIDHKEEILSEDLEKLNDYFSCYMTPDPTILQRCVLFNLLYYLCRRGRENLTGMKKDTFAVSRSKHKNCVIIFHRSRSSLPKNQTIHNNLNYNFHLQVGKGPDSSLFIYQQIDEADKNHNENDPEKSNEGRIYEKKGKINTNN